MRKCCSEAFFVSKIHHWNKKDKQENIWSAEIFCML